MAEAQNVQAPRRNSQNRGEGRRNDRQHRRAADGTVTLKAEEFLPSFCFA